MLHVLIMAGGHGTRFWPESRKLTPKQLLPIVGPAPMLTQTIERLAGLVEPSEILVATNREQVDIVRTCAGSVPKANIIAEPECRDTAPCIGLAALIVAKRDPDAVMLVAPSDHVIRPAEEFQKTVRVAAELALKDDAVFVFGVRPNEPSTAYGYIHRKKQLDEKEGVKVFEVAEFTEKPDVEKARTFLDSGEYYWNSGLYLFRADVVLAEIRRHAPGISEGLERIDRALGGVDREAVINEIYPSLEKISIDYAVTEKAENVKVLEVNYFWSDIGLWISLRDVEQIDEDGNVVRGSHVGIDTKNCVVCGGKDHVIGTVGVSDLVIIQTDDATLVCSGERAQDVKALVEKLKAEGHDSVL